MKVKPQVFNLIDYAGNVQRSRCIFEEPSQYNEAFGSDGLAHLIIRGYLTAFWLSPEVSTISPRALANGLVFKQLPRDPANVNA